MWIKVLYNGLQSVYRLSQRDFNPHDLKPHGLCAEPLAAAS
jgi:hypothetical protein